MKSNKARYTIFMRAMSLTLTGLALSSCSSTPTTPPPGGVIETSGQIIYSRNRDLAGNVAPVLVEGAGFDGGEVDSPDICVDGGRVGGDKFMLFYEAADGSGNSTIGLVTSNEEDLVIRTIDRMQVVGLGPGGSPYEAGATDPSVLVDKRPSQTTARYKMWFEGRGGAGGNTSTIMYGTSADGVTWSAFTPCTGLNPSYGSVRVADPSVALDDSVFKMWFEAINSTAGAGDGPGVIGYAESTDGIAWTVKDASGNTGGGAAPVLTTGAGTGFDGYSVNAPAAVINLTGGSARYQLWYEAGDKPGDVQNTIGYATSTNGLNWTRATLPVFVPSSDLKVPLPFDSGDLEHPTAAVDNDFAPNVEGHFLLWYTGDGEGGASPNRIGLAWGHLP